MRRKPKRRDAEPSGRNLLLVLIAALFVVLLLVRMLAFVAGRHHF